MTSEDITSVLFCLGLLYQFILLDFASLLLKSFILKIHLIAPSS